MNGNYACQFLFCILRVYLLPLTNTTPTPLYKSLEFRYPRLELYCNLPVFLEDKILPVSVKVVL
ncbi:hypothetical protein L873DRAFT_1796963 [Choiromyces venosus 120613-1]|uniref:Uncharacterized protein n=1 Tax=Choiromyces venosus 120613-1 TaxID=1336337 RepID=A0A3N4K9S7_9PEZI|nr:hypothetical protein L873DRAFT_1796963 [Choiromyces venosus 120613-1]